MSKTPGTAAEDRDTMRPEYDFSGAVRGITAQRYARGANVVVVAPDLLDVFPDGESVDEALRALAPILRLHGRGRALEEVRACREGTNRTRRETRERGVLVHLSPEDERLIDALRAHHRRIDPEYTAPMSDAMVLRLGVQMAMKRLEEEEEEISLPTRPGPHAPLELWETYLRDLMKLRQTPLIEAAVRQARRVLSGKVPLRREPAEEESYLGRVHVGPGHRWQVEDPGRC